MEKDNVRWNFVANMFDGALYAFALSFISTSTVIPLFVKKIGGSNIEVGMVPVLWTLSFNFPQIIIANYARSKPYKKSLLLKTALVQRIPWIVLAFVTYFVLSEINIDIRLIVFFFFFFLAGLGGSLNFPGWFDLISKLTPVNLRGRLFGLRALLGAVFGVIGGWLVKIILSSFSYPVNFTLLFCIAFSIMMISYIFLLTIKEDKPNQVSEQHNLRDYFRRLPEIVKINKNFRNFLIADSLLISASTADAFYSLNALNKFNLDESFIGNFTIVAMISTILSNLLFGYFADLKGHKINLIIAALGTIAACVNSIISNDINVYYLSFVGSAITITLIALSRTNIVAELCAEEDRPIYIALTNLITTPFVFAGILSGWVSNYYGYNIIFIISGILAICSAGWLFFMVDEPRKKVLYNN